MTKRFIVLVELTASSSNLLSLAYRLASAAGIKMVVIHQSLDPVPVPVDGTSIVEMKEDIRSRSRIELRKFVVDAIGDHSNVSYEATTGSLAEAVVDLQSPGVLDFIFTGIRHKDFLEKILFGSTAVKLSDYTEGIIISVPDNIRDLDLSGLNVALIKKYPLNGDALRGVISLSGKPDTLRFISVATPQQDSGELIRFLKETAMDYKNDTVTVCDVLNGENVLNEITRFHHTMGGTIVLQKGPRTVTDLFRTYFVNAVVYDAQMPVIILPQKAS